MGRHPVRNAASGGGNTNAFLPDMDSPALDSAGESSPGRRGRFVLRWLWHVVFVAAWILILLMGALTWLPHVTKARTDIIVGHSMEPTIPLYSVIIDEEVPPSQIRKGDVITFQEPDQPDRKVTHRVARIEYSKEGTIGFITKGDNNESRDPWRVEYSGSAYRVKTHVPRVGWLMIQSQTKWARLLLVALPVLIILVEFLRWLWRDEDEELLEGDADVAYEWEPDQWDAA